MANCPRCKKYFRVLEDESPESHYCPKCGYMPQGTQEKDEEDSFYTTSTVRIKIEGEEGLIKVRCPIKNFSGCIEEECAWWISKKNHCAVKEMTMATGMVLRLMAVDREI